MKNMLASALVALLVSVAVSGAADQQPKPKHGDLTEVPGVLHYSASPQQRIDALAARVDKLQVRLADTRAIAQQARNEADGATSLTDCVDGGIWMFEDDATGYWLEGDGTEPGAVVLPVLNTDCTDQG